MSPTHSINAKINAGASIYKSNTSSATSSINGNNSNSNSETTFPLEIPETFPEFEESLSNFTYLHFEYRQHLERQFSIIPVLTVERPIGGGDYSSHLNDTECHKLRTLVTLFSEPINPAILTPTGVLYCEMYATIGHNLELLMVDVIRKCNRLDDFANICESDRYNLIKYGCVELSYMRNISRLQQHVYMYLLQRYLLLRSGSEMDGRTKFASLMKTVIDLKYFAQKHRERIETFTNRNLVPNGLLTELFDLKCNVDICYSDTI
ncbi:unnamed protein product [Medioppia subpectinata]|uniref:Uncharacterized protein n=1 Tax=Medioppia subpectinata TaxID=1979941 RepID=A0A7R9PYQ1_9ACAR|nr:unnamed protein product [Medioppia subpectinata]CAG2105337.1 unnamed protein product [Medioppia subpectinata]